MLVCTYTLNNLIGEGVYCSDCLYNLSEAICVPRSLIDIHGYISLRWLSSLSIISTPCEEYFCRQFSRFRLCVQSRCWLFPKFSVQGAPTVPIADCFNSSGGWMCWQFRLPTLSTVQVASYFYNSRCWLCQQFRSWLSLQFQFWLSVRVHSNCRLCLQFRLLLCLKFCLLIVSTDPVANSVYSSCWLCLHFRLLAMWTQYVLYIVCILSLHTYVYIYTYI
jgi:hypothetical protein